MSAWYQGTNGAKLANTGGTGAMFKKSQQAHYSGGEDHRALIDVDVEWTNTGDDFEARINPYDEYDGTITINKERAEALYAMLGDILGK